MFNPCGLLALSPLMGLAVYCLFHVLVSRLVRKRGNYFPLLVGCLCGLAITLIVSAAALVLMHAGPLDFLALAGMNLVAYLAFSFGYFNFINLLIASLRIRMVQELAECGGAMPVEALLSLYNTEQVISVRINRLVSGGHLTERQGRFYSGKRKFLIVGRIFDFLRWLIIGTIQDPGTGGLWAADRSSQHQGTFMSEAETETDCDLSLFVACYNEEDLIIATLNTVLSALTEVGCSYDITVIDDASKDRSVELIERFMSAHPEVPMKLIVNSYNQGLGVNYVEAAFHGRGKYFRAICGDDVETKETLVSVFKRLGEADIILTYHTDARARSWSRRQISRAYTNLVNLISGCRIKYYNGLAVLRRYDVMRWHPNSPGFGFQADLVTRLLYMKASYIEIPVIPKERATGKSHALKFKNICSVAHSLLEIFVRRIARVLDRGRYERLASNHPQSRGSDRAEGRARPT